MQEVAVLSCHLVSKQVLEHSTHTKKRINKPDKVSHHRSRTASDTSHLWGNHQKTLHLIQYLDRAFMAFGKTNK